MSREDNQHTNYQAYLLRLRREGSQTFWHAWLHTATEQVYHFATAESLFALLAWETV